MVHCFLPIQSPFPSTHHFGTLPTKDSRGNVSHTPFCHISSTLVICRLTIKAETVLSAVILLTLWGFCLTYANYAARRYLKTRYLEALSHLMNLMTLA
jgi:hypothetical protein